jgi:hypothetical protein
MIMAIHLPLTARGAAAGAVLTVVALAGSTRYPRGPHVVARAAP